ncbi:hypothetical protein L615_002900000070 [Nocardioides sp. J9]|uniref:EboA domain-containing protein n=1 Tax=unclassified Nocardioides TaxID=2615069 RepID=UPI0004BCF726|nr:MULTISPECIES: EboA domain-containing protein [unclassified Nocardioides]TWG98996.1 hypothetical protein L615_002900000070 [Nocardioides sp. J9]
MTSTPLLVPADRLRSALPPAAVAALDEMAARVAADPRTLGRVFPAAARRTARGDLGEGGPRIEDAVRVELVVRAAAALGPEEVGAELEQLYRYGDADEKRAVLLALSVLDGQVDGREVLLDALRTNDVRLVAAAMGPHARTLSDHEWRHGVLKCLFVGVPLAEVADLDTRADAELVAMVRRYADERRAAGRPVPEDATSLLARTDTTTGQEG